MRRLLALPLLAALIATLLPGVPAAATLLRSDVPVAAAAPAALACSTDAVPTNAGEDVSLTATLGTTTATLTGVSGSAFLRNARVRDAVLTRQVGDGSAQTWHPKPVTGTPGRGVLVAQLRGSGGTALGQLCVARFHRGGRVVALLALTSAYNQCCYAVRTFAPALKPSSSLQGGVTVTRVRDAGDHVVLRGGDDTFFSEFADFADSVPPVRVLGLRAGRQVDVSTSHPETLRRDARRWWSAFESADFGLGFLAAWAADQDRLGHSAKVDRRLADLNAARRLTVPAGLEDLWPAGSAYIKALHTFLVQHGYR